ncbi:MAG: DUF2852 domain-containing protein [Rhodobiaceae bacterium]|nr:DUF2852 domain-containing protein [Rhodobiaceae bacterium]
MSAMKGFPIPPKWTPLNIVLMVIGFMVYWPLGLAMIAWIVWGEKIVNRVQDAEVHWRAQRSGNKAFDDYRREELERLEEKRRELDREAEDFQSFLRELRSAKDKQEFDRFMAARRSAASRAGSPAGDENLSGGAAHSA